MKSDLQCAVCDRPLSGRQRRFCSRACKNRDTNVRHQNYASQQIRGRERKLQWVKQAGGRCTRCGYDRNLAALAWHHEDPATKLFNLDIRAMSNRRSSEIRAEVAKCVLLCANCHAEEHFPELMMR